MTPSILLIRNDAKSLKLCMLCFSVLYILLSTQLKHLALLAMFMFSVCTQIAKQKRVQVSPNDGQTKIDVAHTLYLSTQTRMEHWKFGSAQKLSIVGCFIVCMWD